MKYPPDYKLDATTRRDLRDYKALIYYGWITNSFGVEQVPWSKIPDKQRSTLNALADDVEYSVLRTPDEEDLPFFQRKSTYITNIFWGLLFMFCAYMGGLVHGEALAHRAMEREQARLRAAHNVPAQIAAHH